MKKGEWVIYDVGNVEDSDSKVIITKLQRDVDRFPEGLRPVVIGDMDLLDRLERTVKFYVDSKN